MEQPTTTAVPTRSRKPLIIFGIAAAATIGLTVALLASMYGEDQKDAERQDAAQERAKSLGDTCIIAVRENFPEFDLQNPTIIQLDNSEARGIALGAEFGCVFTYPDLAKPNAGTVETAFIEPTDAEPIFWTAR